MFADGQEIESKTIYLDGASLYGCKLKNCKLVFNGLMNYTMVDCQFEGCTWAFNGPAASYLNFLRHLYAQGATEVVDAIFDAIKSNAAIPGVPEDNS